MLSTILRASTKVINTSSSLPATTSLRYSCSDSSPTVRACGMLSSRLRLMQRKHSISDSESMLPEALLQMPIRSATTASSRSLPTRLSPRRELAGRMTSSSLEATYMPLTQRLSSFVSRRSSGRCTGRIKAREASRYIRCMTSRLLFLHSSTSLKPEYTI